MTPGLSRLKDGQEIVGGGFVESLVSNEIEFRTRKGYGVAETRGVPVRVADHFFHNFGPLSSDQLWVLSRKVRPTQRPIQIGRIRRIVFCGDQFLSFDTVARLEAFLFGRIRVFTVEDAPPFE